MRISFFVQRRRVKRERAPPIVAEGSPGAGRCGGSCRAGCGEAVTMGRRWCVSLLRVGKLLRDMKGVLCLREFGSM